MKPFTDNEKREGVRVALERLRELARNDTTGVMMALESIRQEQGAINWTWKGVEVHKIAGNELTMDPDLCWALLPFYVRAFDIRGGAYR